MVEFEVQTRSYEVFNNPPGATVKVDPTRFGGHLMTRRGGPSEGVQVPHSRPQYPQEFGAEAIRLAKDSASRSPVLLTGPDLGPGRRKRGRSTVRVPGIATSSGKPKYRSAHATQSGLEIRRGRKRLLR